MEPEFVAILQTAHTDPHAWMAKIIAFLERFSADARVPFVADLLTWGTLIPDDPDRGVDRTHLGSPEEVTVALALLNDMLTAGKLPNPRTLELGTTPTEGATIVLRHLDSLAGHDRLVQAAWLTNVVGQHPDIPFIKHLPPVDLGEPVETGEVIRQIAKRPELLMELRKVLGDSQKTLHGLTLWLRTLPARTGGDPALAYAFTRYALTAVLSAAHESAASRFRNIRIVSLSNLPDALDEFMGTQEADPGKKPN